MPGSIFSICAPALGDTGLPWTKIIISALIVLGAVGLVVLLYIKRNK